MGGLPVCRRRRGLTGRKGRAPFPGSLPDQPTSTQREVACGSFTLNTYALCCKRLCCTFVLVKGVNTGTSLEQTAQALTDAMAEWSRGGTSSSVRRPATRRKPRTPTSCIPASVLCLRSASAASGDSRNTCQRGV